MIKLKAKQEKINESYNAGILEIVEKNIEKDIYNTEIESNSYNGLRKFWFRYLGVSSTEQYTAMQVDTIVSTRVAIKLYEKINQLDIHSNIYVKIKNKIFSVSRIYHNYKKNETELSLVEVI